MKCNPHVVPAHNTNGWYAWCPCGWETKIHPELWQAKNDKLEHQGKEPETHPPWIRGPR